MIRELGLPLTTRQLAKQVSATVADGTALINITVSDSSAAQAARIADAIAHRLRIVADGLTPKTTDNTPKIELVQVQEARPQLAT